ncbi:MAG: UDP-N-acetylmuramoyl-L-alanine--D-glutamate ligase, partial [Oscillospiraceae bacterium]|nr:UDP-N-acetylmuramoyl-L-alanine--D-glutamate ligase [Oscillospiraceae bacterium]
NGKTTTTTLVGEICKNAGRLTWVAGNIGLPLTAVAGQTHPEDVVVVEVSSFQCESLDTFQPDVAAVLNITEDHLNRHGAMCAYIAMKRRIFEKQTDTQVAVLNWDDPVCRDMAAGLAARVMWFSRRQAVPEGAFLQNEEVMVAMDGAPPRALCRADEIKIPGAHNLENALAAAVMTAALGVPLPVIRHTLRTFLGVEHRIEFVRELDGVRYINDSKGTNVDATLKAVEAMRAPTVLLAGGSDKGVDFAPLAQGILAQPLIRHVVLIGATAQKIAAALDNAGYKSYEHAGSDMARAVDACRALAGPGWNVLLSPACASFDMFKDFEHRGEVFKQLVQGLR